MAEPGQILAVLCLGGLMGLLGQGARTVVGLKSMTDDARTLGVSPSDLFQAARILTGLMIGFVVGLAAALVFIANGGSSPDWQVLIGFAATGYLGTDFLEGFISNYLTGSSAAAALVLKQTSPANKGLRIMTVPANAKQFVYMVLDEMLPDQNLTDSTKLSDLGFDDNPSKDTICGTINRHRWHGVNLAFGALNSCAKVSDVTAVVAAAEKP